MIRAQAYQINFNSPSEAPRRKNNKEYRSETDYDRLATNCCSSWNRVTQGALRSPKISHSTGVYLDAAFLRY